MRMKQRREKDSCDHHIAIKVKLTGFIEFRKHTRTKPPLPDSTAVAYVI
jgi:hypothetical protein